MSAGLRWMVLGAVFFSLMGLGVRSVPRIPFMEVVVFRAGVSLVISAALLWRAGKSLWGRNRGLLLLRGVLGFVGLCAYVYTIQNMPLAEAVTIQYTNPLFTALLAPLLLKERWRGGEWLSTLTAFVGVCLIANPTTAGKWGVALIGVGGAMCSGLAYNVVRKLGLRGEEPLTVVMYFPVVAAFLGLPFAVADWVEPTPREWAWLLFIGVATQIAQVALTHGLRLERAARATTVNFLVIFLSTLYSLLLGETLGWNSWAGMAVILAALYAVTRTPAKVP